LLWRTSRKRRARARREIATTAGLLIEIFQLRTGTYRMTSGTLIENFPPLWMLALWAQFATTFRYSLRGIISRPALAGVFGVIGAPLAFLAGERLGALALLPPETLGLERLAISWGVAMYAFAILARRAPPGSYGTTGTSDG
jgi:hypothetical protein